MYLKKGKSILSVYAVLIFLLFVFISPNIANAKEIIELKFGEIYTYGDLYYEINGEGISIVGCNSNAINVVIPKSINNYNVNYICCAAFANCKDLSSIEIPEGVANIDFLAFSGCTNLTNINMPKSIVRIGDLAFNNCSKDLTIKGYSNSYVEEYAKKNSISFIAINDYKDLEISRYKVKKIGEKIKFGVAATGKGTLNYRFVVLDSNGKNIYTRGYSQKNYCTWTPFKSGLYKIYFKVKDNTGKEIAKNINYEIN